MKNELGGQIMKEFFGLRIQWRLSTILEINNKSVWSNVFWYVKVCIFWKCIQYIIHWDKTNAKENSFGQNKRYKKSPLFSLARSNSSQFYFLICDSHWSTGFVSLKLYVGISIFDFISFLLKFIFLLSKMHGPSDFKMSYIIHFKIKIIVKPHTFLFPDLWFISRNKYF